MLRLLSAMAMISTTLAMSVLTPGANVVVVGGGAIQSLAARLAALRGFSTTVALPEQDMGTARALIFDDANPEGTLPVKLMAISGPEADSPTIEACVENAEGLIICFDNEQAFMPESAMKIFTAGGNLKHIALMSRYLNGEGMGFFPNAAKVAANSEIWAGTDAFVKQFKTQDAMIQTRAKELGASYTIIRAGTLKGGASADAAIAEGGGESDFLNPFFYTLGQQDVVSLVPIRCVLRRLGGLCCLAARVQCTRRPRAHRSPPHGLLRGSLSGQLAPPLRLRCSRRRAQGGRHDGRPRLHRRSHGDQPRGWCGRLAQGRRGGGACGVVAGRGGVE